VWAQANELKLRRNIAHATVRTVSGADLPPELQAAARPPNAPDTPTTSPAPALEPEHAPTKESHAGPPPLLERLAARTTEFAERFVPDAFVFALLATLLVGIAALVSGASGAVILDAWGNGFWDLLPFTTQMALVVISGYVLATSRPVLRVIERLALLPKTGKQAAAFVAFFSMFTSWFNWGFSLIFSAMLALAIARRAATTMRADYRALAASTLLGLGSVWAQGLSGSAALQMATPAALPATIRSIVEHTDVVPGGVIPLARTIFLPQSILSVLIEIVIVTVLAYAIAPQGSRAKTAADLGIVLADHAPSNKDDARGLEHSPLLSGLVAAFGIAFVTRALWNAPNTIAAISLNMLNMTFLLIGMLLHGTPSKFMRAVKGATPAVWGILLQFPFYAGIAAVLVKTGLSERIAHGFVAISTAKTYPALIALYSALLGIFVPSGGSKWIIEAPYVMQAAHTLNVHLGWMVAVYDLGEAVANLVQPFWMLPVLGLFQLRAKDVMGYTFVFFLVLLPVVLILVTVLGATLRYPLG
jgi:short-chain fatty acids transporter